MENDFSTRDYLPIEPVVADIRQFFVDPTHRIYLGKGTPSNINTSSVYHQGQIEVLFENQHFHFRTQRAVKILVDDEKLLRREKIEDAGTEIHVIWKASNRFVKKAIKQHLLLYKLYSEDNINSACGEWAEILVERALLKLDLTFVGKKMTSYKGKKWKETGHDLDYIFEKTVGSKTIGFGIEVKNRFSYMENDEFENKIRMCQSLGILPLFVTRAAYSGQREALRSAGGFLFTFQTKVFPLGQETLVKKFGWRLDCLYRYGLIGNQIFI